MHKTQVKHKPIKNTELKPFLLSDVCAFGLYLCFGFCVLCLDC